MESEDDHDELRRQLEEVTHNLKPGERELWDALQNFIDEQATASGSRERAYAIVRSLLRKARDTTIRERRASFRIVE